MAKRENTYTWRIYIMSMLLMVALSAARAQTVITGKVTDVEGKAVAGVVVRVTPEGADKMLAYAITSAAGEYSVKVATELPKVEVRFARLGYARQSKVVSNATQRIDVRLTTEDVKIKEVRVKAQPVKTHGDTITYNVAAMRGRDDRTIEDVIKRLPGVEVSESGDIKYHGEPINRFYIEGLNMLGSQYQLATRNIRPDDVSEVNVYEHHQPMRVLKDVEYSKQAALNLKLKKSRLARPIGYMVAGAGGSERQADWRGELHALMVGAKGQQLVAAKGNNFGTRYGGESALSQPTTSASRNFSGDPFVNGTPPAERYQDNKTITASVNNLAKLSPTATLTVKGGYDFDAASYEHLLATEYYLPAMPTVVVEQQTRSAMRRQGAHLQMQYEQNSDSLYVMDIFKVGGLFVRNRFDVGGTASAVQHFASDDFSASNTLNFVKRRKKRLLTFNSNLSLCNTPGAQLRATDALADTTMLAQRTGGLLFTTSHSTSFSWLLPRYSRIGLSLLLSTSYEQFRDRLAVMPGVGLTATASEDEATAQKPSGYEREDGLVVVAEVSPLYEYLRSGSCGVKLSMPIRLQDMSFYDKVHGGKHHFLKPIVAPTATFHGTRYTMLFYDATVRYTMYYGGMENYEMFPLYYSYLMGYTPGTGLLSTSQSLSSNASATYRNPAIGIDAMLMAGYAHRWSNSILDADIAADRIEMNLRELRHGSDTWEVAFNGKWNNFYHRRLYALNVAVSGNTMSRMRYGELLRVRSLNCRLGGRFQANMVDSRLNTTIGLDWNHAVQRLTAQPVTTLEAFNAYLKVSVFPLREFEVYATGSFNAVEMAVSDYRTDFYLDGGLRFVKRKYEVELVGRNLTNRRYYTLHTYTSADVVRSEFQLRPAEAILTFRWKF